LQKAKQRYAERGDVNSCGDWLVVALKDAFNPTGREFDLDGFMKCLKENGMAISDKLAANRTPNGKDLRMRMSLVLRRRAAKLGFVVIDGKKIMVPRAKKRREGKAEMAEAASAGVVTMVLPKNGKVTCREREMEATPQISPRHSDTKQDELASRQCDP